MLADEIASAIRHVRTDAYPMSVGEIVGMYENHEIRIDPEFQRLFRWSVSQKSRLVESLLLGIPLPSIFVFEQEDGTWELIDGLQRISTILEFMGKLRSPDGGLMEPSALEATNYLPSLHNAVWEKNELSTEIEVDDQYEIGKAQQLAIRRARIGIEILKRPSDNQTKFDLFQRLNAGGTQANAQELRNCIILMVNGAYYQSIKRAAEQSAFQKVVALSDDAIEQQRHIELAVRFLVHTYVPYDGKLDVEEFIDKGIVGLANASDGAESANLIRHTFELLSKISGKDTLRRLDNGHHIGKAGLVGLEGIAVGVGKNLKEIQKLQDPVSFIREKILAFWSQPETANFTRLGLRGTTRIQRTVPFGEAWFRP